MIYLITGVPGSGKTLYAVSTLVQDLVNQKLEKDGQPIKRRLVVDGIPNLLLDHVPLAPIREDSDTGKLASEGDSVLNWPDWVQPGDVIVIDEVQRYWRPRGMGMKPPEMIKALETHRHKGCDFVIITQNPMLIDQNVRRLVGRHQNIRRLLGFQRATIYDWDACSTTMNPRTSTAMSYFSYPKSAYALYKSSELHTKQRQKIPVWMYVPVLAVIGAIAFGPQAFAVMSNTINGKPMVASSVPPVTASKPANAPSPSQVEPSVKAEVVRPGETPDIAQSSRKFAGCIRVVDRCQCLDAAGVVVKVEPSVCDDLTSKGREKPVEFAQDVSDRRYTVAQLDALAFSFAPKRK